MMGFGTDMPQHSAIPLLQYSIIPLLEPRISSLAAAAGRVMGLEDETVRLAGMGRLLWRTGGVGGE